MRTVFRDCFLVNFALDPAVLRRVIPPPLELDLHQGEAYLSVVIADMVRMRPAFLPPVFGLSYIQVVYRAVVRHRGERGVYFVRSDANHRLMARLGDWFTFFRFHYAPARLQRAGDHTEFALEGTQDGAADIRSRFLVGEGSNALPPASRFAQLPEARAFLVELFVAFGITSAGTVRPVRIKRGTWNVRVVPDAIGDYRLLGKAGPFGPDGGRLDSAFHVTDVPYHWYRLGRGGHHSLAPMASTTALGAR
jgi:uncharacterized protein YqjF (DUF2071 family)